jgi:oxygen-dependent protoporphyrinogen oxidase
MFPGRAPEGCVAIAGYFGGARSPDLARLPEDDLIGLARQEFGDLIGARGAPVVARVKHWPLGLPQYEIGHLERTACLRDAEKRTPGLFVTGNYFDGPSVAACLGQAEKTARAVHGYLSLAVSITEIRVRRLMRSKSL